ncbi:hypothetical protein HK097_011560 [Rhizophlyctis rosea]|uniref:Glycoside hydrolase 131 catalytic N-terminal domain-containing protein n=1 Tax=Rhizophlyctis rosea TaxID=64517 RepID=A0AAD5S7N6_9FUNG|nr:hypothetical protein HK097_011560 [Rhizophlyctis rosea]
MTPLPTVLVVLFFSWFSATLAASPSSSYKKPSPPSPPSLPVKCPVVFDGRVPRSTTLKFFDTDDSFFNPNYTKGENLPWSQILTFPTVPVSKFDAIATKPSKPDPHLKPTQPYAFKSLQVSINDSSIFVPGGGSRQVGFRRAGLLAGNGSDAQNVGVKTFHWSVRQPAHLKLNLTHEYMFVWHEANDYASNQFSINAGVMLAQDDPKESVGGNYTGKTNVHLPKNLWKVLDRKNNVIWKGPMKAKVWENFAITLDYERDRLRVYYSIGNDKLKAVTNWIKQDNSGGGQFQIGIAKKPTETVSVVFDGYHESGIHEAQIYGGIFVEDSKGGCLSA